VYRLTVRKKNNPQVSIFHVTNYGPAANAAIFLNCFILRVIHGVKDPLILDYGTIGPVSDGFKVFCDFHPAFLAGGYSFKYRKLT
jgi:hypothetical protein